MERSYLTGDFDSRDSMLVEGAKLEKTDILFIEGTYGGRNHPNQEEERRRFCEEIVQGFRQRRNRTYSGFCKWKNTRYCYDVA